MNAPPLTPDTAWLPSAAQDRAARFAVTVFPVIIILAGVLGMTLPDTFKPLAPRVPILLGVILFSMGLTLTKGDFLAIARRPWAVGIGVVAHYVIMPGVAWVVARLLGLPGDLAAGLILLGCSPSGTSSSVMVFLSRGNVALGVSIATVSTLLSPLITPFLTLYLAGSFLKVDAASMVHDILTTVLIPVILGAVLRLFFDRQVDRILPALPWVSTIVIASVVAIVMARSSSKIMSAGALVLLAVMLHNAVGMGLGFLAGKLTGLPTGSQRALAFECGMQNSGLAAALATAHFSPLAALPAAVATVWHNLAGAFLAMAFRRSDR